MLSLIAGLDNGIPGPEVSLTVVMVNLVTSLRGL